MKFFKLFVKMWYTHTHTHIYTHTHTQRTTFIIIKTKKIFPFATSWMNFMGIMLSEINQTKKVRYCMISLYLWNLETTAN